MQQATDAIFLIGQYFVEHVGSTGLKVKGVGLLFSHLHFLLLKHHLRLSQGGTLVSEFGYELYYLLFGADKSPDPAYSFGVFFSGIDVDLDGSDAALRPPIEAVDDLHDAFFPMLDCCGMSLLALDEVEFHFFDDWLKEGDDLAGGDVETENKLHVGGYLLR